MGTVSALCEKWEPVQNLLSPSYAQKGSFCLHVADRLWVGGE